MRSGLRPAIIAGMPSPPPIVVTLELVAGAVPIEGRLECGGHEAEFTGWLELARVLQLAHDREAAAHAAAAAARRRAALRRAAGAMSGGTMREFDER